VLALVALLWRWPRWSTQPGTLQVADDSSTCWQGDGIGTAGEMVELHRWQFAARFAWLELRTARGQHLRLVLERSAFGADQWAALGRWLTWVGRGQRSADLKFGQNA